MQLLKRDIGTFIAAEELSSAEMLRLRILAEELTLRRPSSEYDSLESLQSSRHTILYPHQIHAAHSAVSNPLLKGTLLADDVGLGKTVEAGMIIKEMYYRGRANVLVVCGKSLRQQWAAELRDRFALDFQVLDRQAAARLKRAGKKPWEGLRICTPYFLNTNLGDAARTIWDILAVDECHLLKNPQGALHKAVQSVPRSFILLLTATPIQNYLPELHAISTLIDEETLGTAFSFREKFCDDDRGLRVKNLDELKRRLSRFAVRTVRGDVPEIKFTKRIPKLFNFELPTPERELYEQVSAYLSRPNWAFGEDAPGKYLILMVYRKLLASSSFALLNALRKVEQRLAAMAAGKRPPVLRIGALGADVEASAADMESDIELGAARGQAAIRQSVAEELEEVRGYLRLAESIEENAKGLALVRAMPELLESGDKVLVFTQYKATQGYLVRKLEEAGYHVVPFSGDLKSHANPEKDERELAKLRFRDDADVMVATDAGAEGLNLQFCHVVVNYDLPWNPMKIEQRIGRAHRLGQEHDVVAANLVALGNEVERRLVELLTDKINLFGSVLGESDEILGNLEDAIDFERRIFEILQTCRTPEQIEAGFRQLQLDLDDEIQERRSTGQQLLTGFDDRIRDHLAIAEREGLRAAHSRARRLEEFLLGSLRCLDGKCEQKDGVYRIVTPSLYFLASDQLIDSEYRGTFDKHREGDAPLFNRDHPLIRAGLAIHKERGARGAVSLEYTGRHTIHGMEELVGAKGWWLVFKVSFTGFEVEDHLVHVALVADEQESTLNELLSESIFRITMAQGEWDGTLPLPDMGAVEAKVAETVGQLREAILERNADYYLERRETIESFYGARGDGEVLAELRAAIRERQTRLLALEEEKDSVTRSQDKLALADEIDKVNEDLFRLQQRLQTEQLQNFERKREELRKLEALRVLQEHVDLVGVAQWGLQ